MPHAHHSKKAARRGGRVAENSQLDQGLLKVVDGGLAACIFLVPLLMGGRQALGQLALVSLAVVVAVAWMLRQCLRSEPVWRRSSVELLLLAGVLLLVAQITPWPKSMLAWMAPQTASILPLWTGPSLTNPSSLGNWSCVSMTPGVTRAALAIFLAYGLLFLVTVQRIRALADVERLLRWIALSAVMMAVFGLVQWLTSNDKFFWFYEHPFARTSDGVKGSFTNRNHFAHFLALGIGPLIWWLQDGLKSRVESQESRAGGFRSPPPSTLDSRLLTLGIVLFAGLMSLSRGGMMVMLLAAAISVVVCYRAKRLQTRFVFSLAAVALLIVALLAVHGLDRVSQRMGELSSASIDQLDEGSGRRTIWAAVCKAIPDFALLGSGAGSHRDVYPIYLENAAEKEFTHAENGPLQVLLETGVVGLALITVGVGFCAFWCLGGLRRSRSGDMSACLGAISASLAISVVHSLADFVWYVPACMAIVAVLAGCACRGWQLTADSTAKSPTESPPTKKHQSPTKKHQKVRPRAVSLPKPVAVAVVVLLLGTGTWMVAGRLGPTRAEPHWDRYRVMKLASSGLWEATPSATGDTLQHRSPTESPPTVSRQQAGTSADIAASIADGVASHKRDVYEASLEAITRMIGELEQVVRYDGTNARAHLELAAAYLHRFELTRQKAENAMALADIRDAVAQARSKAQTRQQQHKVEQWLVERVSEHGNHLRPALEHVRRGLALCPLQGEGYLYLAELSFLDGPQLESSKQAYIDQAQRVRPFDGGVLFEAGRLAIDRAAKILAAAGNHGAPPDAQTLASFNREFARGMDCWKRSFQSGPQHQKRLIEALAGRVPVKYFVGQYQPGLYAMRLLRGAYVWLGQPERAGQIHRLYADRCRAEGRRVENREAAMAWFENELAQLHGDYARIARAEAQHLEALEQEGLEAEQAARTWLEAAWFYHLTDDLVQSLQCAQSAYRCDPNGYDVRYTLALRLIDRKKYIQAVDHLQWCSQKRPDDEKLQWLVRETEKNRIRLQNRSISQSPNDHPLR